MEASNGYINDADMDIEAVFEVDTTEKENPPALTRMPSIAAGKTQVMEITITSLSEGKYLTTSMSKKTLPAQSLSYWAICTKKVKGTQASVGLAYFNSKGQWMTSGKMATLTGVDSYGSITSNAQYLNYGYVKNTGTGTLEASYVIMK